MSGRRRPSGIATTTSQGSPHGRSQRAIQRRNLFQVELASSEIGSLNLVEALDYIEFLADVGSPKLGRAAVRWHGRFATESTTLTLAESQLALVAVASLCAGEIEALKILRMVVGERSRRR